MNFTPVDNNGLVDGFCLVKSVDIKTSSKGDTYLDMTLGDNDGEINAKLWRYSKEVQGEYEANQIIKVRGTITQYNGSDQLRVEKIRLATKSDGVKIDDFVQSADYTGEQMYNELICIVDSFKEEDLKRLVKKIYEDNRLCMLYWPAAFKLHHALRGGLLMHILSIVRLAQSICNIYPFVDRDLLISGAMLHDISKLEEFEVGESGIASGYSVEGNLIGHLAMGAMMIKRYAQELGINEKTAMLVEHMILSHHGEPEFGAAVRPMFIEAEILSELDLLDSRIFEMREAVSSTKADDFTGRLWALDNRKLYNHGRMDLNEKVKLI
ncbi:MAG: HD domain-containing protein [Acutalibacteraceae bacterium]|nr:HD domain-containing protein [Acutalibacteraceae bacterium]